MPDTPDRSDPLLARLGQVAAVFLKLGAIGFGGPAAHVAMMDEEIVVRRKWLTREHFLDLLGATNLIPGPNSTEMAFHVGYCRAGLAGSLVAGACFTLPAALITGCLAWSYVRYGSLPQIESLLFGVKPAVLAVILAAVWRLARPALRRWQLVAIAAGVVASVFAGCDEVLTLLGGAAAGVVLLRLTRRNDRGPPKAAAGAGAALAAGAWGGTARAAGATLVAAAGPAVSAAGGAGLVQLALFFLKVGAVLYGTGYVLVAYMEGGLVGQYYCFGGEHVFGQKELLDAIAIGQFTPGPLLTAATFVGYLIARWPGAVVCTVAIMLPAFVLVLLTNPLIPRLRQWRWTALFLDAVNAASIGLMAAVTVSLAAATLVAPQTGAVEWRSCLIATVAAATALRFKLQPAWLVLGGGVAGWVLGWV